MSTTVNGVDVASYQASDYPTAGLDFVVVKATEGSSYVNPKHSGQVATARAHGLVVGHYHFVRPGSMSAQVDYFLAHAGAKAGDFLALDWEDPGVSNADKDAWLHDAKSKVPEHRVIMYSNRDYWLHRDITSYCADGLWIADPSAPKGKPRVEHPWLFHQYSSAGGIDRNVGNFASRAALASWAGARTPKPPAKPAAPKVDLSNLIAAAKADPKGKQGHQTHAADVRIVEAALKAEGYLTPQYAGDGSFGSVTVAAYAKWQRHLGYSGHDADGIPGKASLTALGKRHGFTVTA
ncbi:GH25 family lysozyme [Actinacidiphila epipremni]|uniref:Hydrolase n=1 Tax=Actinacidiphila epipremni TaxID=2053013 RepID=A0ABX0ZJ99_9ACTN|nr:GH25 family lysozyme [Actinacidiphila epipremni]NJP42264.1 hydrolase [Actinacidiphila epipremni]